MSVVAATVTFTDALSEENEAVIVAVPSPAPLTTPSVETGASAGALDDHVTAWVQSCSVDASENETTAVSGNAVPSGNVAKGGTTRSATGSAVSTIIVVAAESVAISAETIADPVATPVTSPSVPV